MAVIAEIAMFPLGTCDTSMSKVLADSVKVLDKYGLNYEITSTGTNVEGDLNTIMNCVKEMEEVPFSEGADRVIFMLRVDDRRDKPITMDYEEEALKKKL